MKHKTSELDGVLLDAAVAMAEGYAETINTWGSFERWSAQNRWKPSESWADGGPIIDRERINSDVIGERWWLATPTSFTVDGRIVCQCELEQTGPTLLIAAMRAYVASKFGDEVELP